MRTITSVLAAAALLLTLHTAAVAAPAARLTVRFTPERLGQPTTVGFSIHVDSSPNEIPAPLASIAMDYPVGLEFELSELGLASCSMETLNIFGPPGCPTNSLMGYGTALAEVPLGPSTIRETAKIVIFHTRMANDELAVLIYAYSETPVSTEVIIPGTIRPASAPFGGQINIAIPPIPGLPQGSNVALVELHATLGPQHIHYNERRRGKIISYQPRGIPLPRHCPVGGFHFAATLNFLDDTSSTANATVACPNHRKHQ